MPLIKREKKEVRIQIRVRIEVALWPNWTGMPPTWKAAAIM